MSVISHFANCTLDLSSTHAHSGRLIRIRAEEMSIVADLSFLITSPIFLPSSTSSVPTVTGYTVHSRNISSFLSIPENKINSKIKYKEKKTVGRWQCATQKHTQSFCYSVVRKQCLGKINNASSSMIFDNSVDDAAIQGGKLGIECVTCYVVKVKWWRRERKKKEKEKSVAHFI